LKPNLNLQNLKNSLFVSAQGLAQKAKEPGFYKKLLNKKVFFPALIAIFAFFFLISFVKNHISCVGGFPVYKKSKKEITEKAPEEIPFPVKVYKVARVNFRDTLPSLGSIKGFRELDLKFPVPGNVEYINFKEGEKIIQGDIIASLDQKEALLKLEYAKIELDKNTRLFELGSIAEAKLKQSQLEYQSARVELDKTNLIAISDGYIGSIEIDRGSYVTPQDKVGAFVDLKDVYVDFGIIEKDIAKVKEGQNVEISVDSYPDEIFKGQVDSVSPIVEGRSRTVEVRSRITNVDEKIKPGMFGRVNVLVYEKEDAIVIPSSSFKKKEDQYFVYLVHPEEAAAIEETEPVQKPSKKKSKDKKAAAPVEIPEEPKALLGTIEIRQIEVTYATPDAIEVKEGLEEGDLVIVDVEQELQDRAKVEITETQEGIF
jgi:membrane fusion protein (multidrug efflux system)